MPSPTQKEVPTRLKPFTCFFDDIDTEDETLVVQWLEPQDDQTTIQREERYKVGEDVLLDTTNDISVVPFEQLEAAARMASLLGGSGAFGVQLGSAEFADTLVDQGGGEEQSKNFQTIVGTAKIDSVIARPELGIEGNIYDIVFKRSSGSDRKTIQTDVKTMSNYKMGLNRYFFAAMCVPGWIKKDFASYNKSNLDATKRQDIIDALPDKEFWV